jgi:dihydrofolate reductase
MPQLLHVTHVSLDGYIEDEDGSIDFGDSTDDDLFTFIDDILRPLGTHLYGRRLYETMAVWETDPALAAQSPRNAAFAEQWQAADKVVFSTTLDAVSTSNTRLERTFDPAAVRRLKASATSDVLIGGADLAGQALAAGVIDELHLFIRPVVLGGGKPALPESTRLALDLVDQRRLGGVTYLRYRVPT